MKQCYHNIYSQEMNKNLQEITATKVCWYYTQISSLEVAVQLRKWPVLKSEIDHFLINTRKKLC